MVDNMPATGKRPSNPDPIRSEPVSAQREERTASRWPNDRILKLLGIDLPIIQAPMAGATTSAMAIAVAQAGGLGSIAGAMLSLSEVRAEFGVIRAKTSKPINLNFFCHADSISDPARETAWRQRLKSYYLELGLCPEMPTAGLSIAPFSALHCDLVADLKPEIVSFHFGLPREGLVSRIKAAGSKILCSATSVKEAVWLEQRGCDAIIAQGWEAGGHRGMFLCESAATQVGTMALVPQIVDAVGVPIVAAGGIADGRGIAAAFALGASAVQVGTAFLFCPEANVDPAYQQALRAVQDDQTIITNVFTGRPARAIVSRVVRELGPMADDVPAFPLAADALQPLSIKSKAAGSDDLTPHWSGQAAPLGRTLPARELTQVLATEALGILKGLKPKQARCARTLPEGGPV
jgi:nitronate monooxygenase